ncbi:hypothetical protein [Rhodococcus sp. 24CO]|uniref:hypothetical protein n=1 Tax=Rhodococcus sp. 24CO TaxID=3117460 RepID=UPI003D325604
MLQNQITTVCVAEPVRRPHIFKIIFRPETPIALSTQLVRDPYGFDSFDITEHAAERELESARMQMQNTLEPT